MTDRRSKRRSIASGEDLFQVLSEYASGEIGWEMYVSDEMPYQRRYPEDWEDAIVRASRLKPTVDEYSFLLACAKTLVRMGSEYDDLLLRLVTLGPGIVVFSLLYKRYRGRGQKIPGKVQAEVARTFKTMKCRRNCYCGWMGQAGAW